MKKPKKRILLIAIIVSFLALLLSTFFLSEYLARQNAPKKITDIINALNLIDHNGVSVTSQSFKNQPSLIFFGFTHCPEVCPTTLTTLDTILQNLNNKIIQTNIVFITLDPERDTQIHLKEYINYFSNNIIAITGSIKDIKKLSKNWGIFFEKISTDKDEYTLNHTASVFMIDKQGNFKGTIAWGENEQSIIQKIIKLSTY
ncbi:SCO family protein [Alphaproteobacteria bacterium]|nr:SCO family protein [Alphaproteobacteria bacterium]